MSDLIKSALLGNKESANECTQQNIMIPCPFCGSEVIDYYRNGEVIYIECQDCGSRLPEKNYELALKFWNTRTLPIQDEWFSVNDRLPKDGQIVITFKNGVYELQEYDKRRNGWISNHNNWFWSMKTVSHWMPLPESPKDYT